MISFPKWREISWKFVFRGELDYNQYQLKYLEGKQPKHRSLQISLEYIDQSSDESNAFAWWKFHDKISNAAWNYEILQMYFIPPSLFYAFQMITPFLKSRISSNDYNEEGIQPMQWWNPYKGDWISIVKSLLLVWFNDTLLLVLH